MSNIESENYLRSYLYNASVLLVGGAKMSDQELEELKLEDGFDIWARVNTHYQSQGGRSDVVYLSGTQELDHALEHSVIVECKPGDLKTDWIEVGTKNNNKYLWYDVNTYKAPNPFGAEHEWLNNFYRELGTMPFTGMIAVKHLLMMPIKSLTLVGFDFYEHKGVVNYKRDSHLIYPQATWLRNAVRSDFRVSIQPHLNALLDKLEHARLHREAKAAA